MKVVTTPFTIEKVTLKTGEAGRLAVYKNDESLSILETPRGCIVFFEGAMLGVAPHTPLDVLVVAVSGKGLDPEGVDLTALKQCLATEGTNPDGSRRKRIDSTARQVLFFAAMENTGVSLTLNPAFSRWLMGYPKRFDELCPGLAAWELTQSRLRAVIESSEQQDTGTQ